MNPLANDDLSAVKHSIAAIARSVGTPAHLLEDAVSEGLLAKLEADRKGIAPYVVIKRRVIDFLRRQSHSRSHNPPKFVELSDISAAADQDVLLDSATLLTSRQSEILELMRNGMGTKDVAKALNLSVKTIEQHTWQLRRRLKAKSTLQAIARTRTIHAGPPGPLFALTLRMERLERRVVLLEQKIISMAAPKTIPSAHLT